MLVHWALADDIRALHRVKRAVAEGRPLPMVLREQRLGAQRRSASRRVLPRLSLAQLAGWLQDAHVVDGIVKARRPRTGRTTPGRHCTGSRWRSAAAARRAEQAAKAQLSAAAAAGKSLGDRPACSRNTRLKCAPLLKPQENAMSVIVRCRCSGFLSSRMQACNRRCRM